MQNAQPTTNCAKWILKVDYLSISKQQKNFGVSKMQGRVTIGHMATRLEVDIKAMGHACKTVIKTHISFPPITTLDCKNLLKNN